jgi:hypothetical protein
MALKTAMVNRSQNATNPSKAAFEKVVKQLKECDGLIGRGEEAKKKAVKIVNDYLATVPTGEKDIRCSWQRSMGRAAARLGTSVFCKWIKVSARLLGESLRSTGI